MFLRLCVVVALFVRLLAFIRFLYRVFENRFRGVFLGTVAASTNSLAETMVGGLSCASMYCQFQVF